MSWIKKLYGLLRSYYIYRKKISFIEYVKYWRSIKSKKTGKKIKLRIRGYSYPFYCRTGSSDLQIFRDFFLKNDYAEIEIEAKRIIDAGANVGAFSVLYKKRFPNSTIVAIEPDTTNCEMFKLNTMHLQNVILINGSLASEAGLHMKISNPDHAEYSYVTEYANEGVPTISITQIMDKQKWKEVDILKIDIEGGEKEVLSQNIGWLRQTKAMIIELHDYKTNGCSNALIGALRDLDCSLQFSGENFIVINNELQSSNK